MFLAGSSGRQAFELRATVTQTTQIVNRVRSRAAVRLN
jgi:hypothetical protein